MRTTVAIDDELLAAAKQEAHDSRMTLGQYVERALRRELTRPPGSSDVPTVPVFRAGTGPRPGTDLSSTRSILEALDEGVPLESMR
jgi:hypothetical protein